MVCTLMYFRCFLLLLAVQYSFAQPISITPEITPETVVATINGQKFTAGQYQELIATMPEQMRDTAIKQPRVLLEQLALFQNILAEAERGKLDEQSPYRERIAEARKQILVQAQINDVSTAVVVSPDEVKKYYDENRPRYGEAKAKVIFISQILNEQTLDGKPTKKREPAESKKLAADILAKLKAGGDFIELAKQHSDDGSTADKGADFPDAIRPNSASVPEPIREAVLAANAGDIVGPLEHQTGFYIFRIESNDIKPFDQVKGDIYTELKQAGLTKWMDEVKNRSSVTIENSTFFTKPSEPALQQ
jgi:peptidyl-prolyl cis-trans isomerase C